MLAVLMSGNNAFSKIEGLSLQMLLARETKWQLLKQSVSLVIAHTQLRMFLRLFKKGLPLNVSRNYLEKL